MSEGRIGANLLWLVPGVVGGSEEYTVRLLASYARVARGGPEIVLFVNRLIREAHPGLSAAYPTVVAPVLGGHKSLRVAAEATWLSRRMRSEGVDLVHHMGGNMLRTTPPGMVTVHDLQPFAHPGHFSPLKRGYLDLTVPAALRRAVLLVTLSQHTRQDVVQRMGVPAERIVIVPPGLDRHEHAYDRAEIERVRWTYDLGDRPFFIYPGITYEHKNHIALIEAFAALAATRPELLLALSGGVADAESAMRSRIDALGIADRVRRLGRIPRRDLDVLLTEATALAFPSTYEGFGIPVLEAMSRRCPVIASTSTALPEIAADAALFVDPDDVDGWTAAMALLLDDPTRRADLIERGYRRAGDFSWERSTEALTDAYHLALERIPTVNIVVLCPHYAPDVAPTGEVMTSIVTELAALGHRLHVVTSLPWYRLHALEPGWDGQLVRHETTSWGRITRVHPFPTDKHNVPARAVAFGGFTALATLQGVLSELAPDVVLAMSPPLTLGMAGWAVARARSAPFVFNIQDVFPDVAVELGLLTGKRVIATASALERAIYRRSDAVTVLSDDLADNVRAKLVRGVREPAAARQAAKVRVIPNFIDTTWIQPGPRENAYRAEHGLTGRRVVTYAGNVGLSQALDLVLAAAVALRHEPDIAFVINGGGSALADLQRSARGMENVHFIEMQPKERLPEVLAAADLHVVPLKRGLARSSVPSKLYSVLAAGRPIVASVDPGTEVANTVEQAGAGIAVPPDDAEAFTKAIVLLLDHPDEAAAMGASGRRFVESWASPAVVARAYEVLFEELRHQHHAAGH